MAKQALSSVTTKIAERTNTTLNVLVKGQRPICDTHVSKALYIDRMVSGVNAMVAIMLLAGFNQEDAVVMNRAAIDRGLFAAYTLRTVTVDDHRPSGNVQIMFGLPPPDARKSYLNYNYLNRDNGLNYVGTPAAPGIVLVGRYMIESEYDEKSGRTVVTKRDVSLVVSHKDANSVVYSVWTFLSGSKIGGP